VAVVIRGRVPSKAYFQTAQREAEVAEVARFRSASACGWLATASRLTAGVTIFSTADSYFRYTQADAKRLKALEGENARLKKLLADAMLDNAVQMLGKKITLCV
jgi:hypothetical protein